MKFSEARDACKTHRIVYHEGEPHFIEYTAAGETVSPPEGIAEIRRLYQAERKRVTLDQITLTNPVPVAVTAIS